MPYLDQKTFDALSELLNDNLTAWEDEEDSVRGEHHELIDRLMRFDLQTKPLTIFVVEGEHPFDPYYPNELFLTREAAEYRAIDLTRSFLEDYWSIRYEGEKPPRVDATNWMQLIRVHGNDDEFVQQDQWGRWWVEITEKQVIDA